MKRGPVMVAAAAFAVVASACRGGHEDQVSRAPARTVNIDMKDIAFQPTTFTAQRGERVRFVFHNRGQLPHDAFIGDAQAQAEHEREMRQGDDDGHGMHEGGDGKGITVEPGKTGHLTYTFDRTGTIEIGCHQPGHYAAGMKMAVTVA
jgi:uncharacterized cupredoxin-like copper-binding protein